MAQLTRASEGVALPYEVSSEIWAKTIEASAVMQLARRVQLPGAGLEFQMLTGEPEADWAEEAAIKANSVNTLAAKKMKGYTLAVVIPFSNQFRRDKLALYDEIVARAPQALGTKLDATVFGDGSDAPGENFDTFADDDIAEITIEDGNVWAALVAADAAIAEGDGLLNGWAIAPSFKSDLLTATDSIGRPLFITSLQGEGAVPNLLGQPTYIKKGVAGNQLAVAGDWTSAVYGVVEDIKFDVADQASLTIDGGVVNLWERNMFAARFEFEVGFRFKFPEHFARIVEAGA